MHRDLAPEQKVEEITKLNRDMMVKDTFSEAGSPNQNPSEALGVKPLKLGTEMIINRTGAPPSFWPWIVRYIAGVNNHCASPMLNWKTPISQHHGYTPDISAYLQFQFWERIWYRSDEKYPDSKEKPGHWLGVADHVGDLLTYYIYDPDTKRILARSVIRTADPKRDAIPNLHYEPSEIDDDDNIIPEVEDETSNATQPRRSPCIQEQYKQNLVNMLKYSKLALATCLLISSIEIPCISSYQSSNISAIPTVDNVIEEKLPTFKTPQSQSINHIKMQLQYVNAIEDAKDDDWSFIPQ